MPGLECPVGHATPRSVHIVDGACPYERMGAPRPPKRAPPSTPREIDEIERLMRGAALIISLAAALIISLAAALIISLAAAERFASEPKCARVGSQADRAAKGFA